MILCLACFENRLASVFENSSEFRLYKTDGDDICPAGHLSLPSEDSTDRTSAILACGVHLIICGAISGCTRQLIENAGISILPWVKGDVDQVLAAYKDNSLDRLTMPGCHNRPGMGIGMGKGPGMGKCRRAENNGNGRGGRMNQCNRMKRSKP